MKKLTEYEFPVEALPEGMQFKVCKDCGVPGNVGLRDKFAVCTRCQGEYVDAVIIPATVAEAYDAVVEAARGMTDSWCGDSPKGVSKFMNKLLEILAKLDEEVPREVE